MENGENGKHKWTLSNIVTIGIFCLNVGGVGVALIISYANMDKRVSILDQRVNIFEQIQLDSLAERREIRGLAEIVSDNQRKVIQNQEAVIKFLDKRPVK